MGVRIPYPKNEEQFKPASGADIRQSRKSMSHEEAHKIQKGAANSLFVLSVPFCGANSFLKAMAHRSEFLKSSPSLTSTAN